MGADESKGSRGSAGRSSRSSSFVMATYEFPNACIYKSEACEWALLHQCSLDKWKNGHAEFANFKESILACDGLVYKDCSDSFCMSRQGIININKNSSFFSFRKRSKFAKMAEHFEYNHIPAQLSSIHHFRVESVLCSKGHLIVLHLSRSTSQFGLLDLRSNKFLGIFGKLKHDFESMSLSGEISPDMTKCLITSPTNPSREGMFNDALPKVCQLYCLQTKSLLTEIHLPHLYFEFSFDPRFEWQRFACVNFIDTPLNSITTVDIDMQWKGNVLYQMSDADIRRYQYFRSIRFTPDGTLLIGTLIPNLSCGCRDKSNRGIPISISLIVFSSDTVTPLHQIDYQRYTCGLHLCPINYTPVFSVCGSRIAIIMNIAESSQNFVQVYRLPAPVNLQSMCRISILQNFNQESIVNLPLPVKLINYVHFRP